MFAILAILVSLVYAEDIRNPINSTTELCNIEPPNVDNYKNVNLLPKECGIYEEDKIISGNIAGLWDYPWMALLSYTTKQGSMFKCGGSIINDQYILTTAHCISTHKPVSVRIGEHNLDSSEDCEIEGGEKYCIPPAQDLPVLELIRHPNFIKKNGTNDIGLIKVPKMNFSIESIKPICLPLRKDRNFNFVKKPQVIVTGWSISLETSRLNPIKQGSRVSVVDLETCAQKYDQTLITNRQICATGEKQGCVIAGNPLQSIGSDLKMIQHGIVSFGKKYCSSEYPEVYTRVAFYMDWILDTIAP